MSVIHGVQKERAPVVNGLGVVKTRHGGRLVHPRTRGHRLLGSNLNMYSNISIGISRNSFVPPTPFFSFLLLQEAVHYLRKSNTFEDMQIYLQALYVNVNCIGYKRRPASRDIYYAKYYGKGVGNGQLGKKIKIRSYGKKMKKGKEKMRKIT